MIERDIAGAGRLSARELQAISQKSCSVPGALGPRIQWLRGSVTGDKMYRMAPSEELAREHARQGGFPANRVSEVVTIIDPATAE